MSSHHRTPLRRVSRGSLSAISRSTNDNSAPEGLSFLGPALETLTDELDALAQNVEGLNKLGSTLQRFNESFASYLFVQKVNVFCVEWFETPIEESHELAAEREKSRRAAAAALEGIRQIQQQHAPVTDPGNPLHVAERTLSGDATFALSDIHETSGVIKAKPKKTKPKLSAKEKKERAMLYEKVCAVLPLEFRGGDLTIRRQIEHVMDCLLDAENGLKVTDMIRADTNQARVNKCLIALTTKKIVRKVANPGGVVYIWQGLP